MGRARVNLIGEHTDYNDGFVLPVALPLSTRVSVERREGAAPESPYVAAVARVLGVSGFDVRIESDVPIGAGLASSAALTVATARALSDAFGLGLDDREVALAAHRAESVELGIGSGVMDQFAAALGREGEALLIDCRSLEVRRVPLPAEAELLVLDSGVRHENVRTGGGVEAARSGGGAEAARSGGGAEAGHSGGGEEAARSGGGYRERVEECRRAAELLGVRSLRDLVPVAGSGAAIQALPAPLDRRVGHVLAESSRVLRMVAALERGALDEAGALLREGHASLRDLYEVSIPEVDRLAALAEEEGALGARLTGGGFGGCVVALCRAGEAAAVGARVVERAGGSARVVL